MMQPSNSVPWSVRIVTGENDFQRMLSQILVAINNEIPDPSPYPFYNNSSSMRTIKPARKSWPIIRKERINPSSPTGPYIPDNK